MKKVNICEDCKHWLKKFPADAYGECDSWLVNERVFRPVPDKFVKTKKEFCCSFFQKKAGGPFRIQETREGKIWLMFRKQMNGSPDYIQVGHGNDEWGMRDICQWLNENF